MRQKNTRGIIAVALLAVAVMTAAPVRAAEQYRAEVGKDSLLQKAVAWLVDDGWFVENVDSPSGFVKAKKQHAAERHHSGAHRGECHHPSGWRHRVHIRRSVLRHHRGSEEDTCQGGTERRQ